MLRRLNIHGVARARTEHFDSFSAVGFSACAMGFDEFEGGEHMARLHRRDVAPTLFFRGPGHAARARAVAEAINIPSTELQAIYADEDLDGGPDGTGAPELGADIGGNCDADLGGEAT